MMLYVGVYSLVMGAAAIFSVVMIVAHLASGKYPVNEDAIERWIGRALLFLFIWVIPGILYGLYVAAHSLAMLPSLPF